MVKVRDLDEAQLEKQLLKYTKIIKALRRELSKRKDPTMASSNSTQRIRVTGTKSSIKWKTNPEKTNSSLYRLEMREEELKEVATAIKKAEVAPKLMTISKLIINNKKLRESAEKGKKETSAPREHKKMIIS